ncbi:MAG: tetraacyldisaccharide 4'-kinase [Phycisphaerales bacterium JB043]
MIHLPPEPISPLPLGIGALLSPFYSLAIARRNKRFDARKGVVKASVPVVSVGNLSVGGTGKTPLVKRVVYALKLAGFRPGIALRGYGAKIDGVSDEEAEHRINNPGVPVIANPNRVKAISELLVRTSGPRVDCIVLDDAFQHRRVARDADIVLIDATRDPFENHLLPRGWLREPVGSLRRASGVVITHAESASPSSIKELGKKIEAVHNKPALAVTSHAWVNLTIYHDGTDCEEPIEWLAGKRVVACCAIARPRPFLNQINSRGAQLVDAMVLRDHALISRSRGEQLARRAKAHNADAIICTTKDWTKMRHLPDSIWPVPIVRPTLEHLFLSGLQEFDTHIVQRMGGRH